MTANPDVKVKVRQKIKLADPKKWNVIFINDDYTPMNIVTYILMTVFSYNEADAQELMLKVHNDGKAIVGCYHYEIAEAKAADSRRIAESQGYPLRVKLEPEN